MIIQPITKSDIKELAALYVSVFSSPPWNEPWTQKSAQERLEWIYESRGFLGFLVKEKESIQGMALGNIEPFLGERVFYLREMMIGSDKQREGLGAQLLKQLHIHLKEIFVSRSYLITKNESPAAKFYLSNGYTLEHADGFYEISLSS